MKTLTAEELLTVWEQGLNQPLLQRMLIIMAAAYPETSPDSLTTLSIGQRDQQLLQLRAHLFGQQLLNSTVCPQCDQRIEWENRVSDFVDQSVKSQTTKSEFDPEVFNPELFNLSSENYSLQFRLPNSLDIAAVVNCDNSEKAQQMLLTRCIVKAEKNGSLYDINTLPKSIHNRLSQEFETLDPHADIRIQLNCPECNHHWNALFDINRFLWAEINDWAEKMLQTVHRLATAYGWSESEILKLSPVRRQLYIGMLY